MKAMLSRVGLNELLGVAVLKYEPLYVLTLIRFSISMKASRYC